MMDEEGNSDIQKKNRNIYIMGAVGLDCIAEVEKYPNRDDKIRAK